MYVFIVFYVLLDYYCDILSIPEPVTAAVAQWVRTFVPEIHLNLNNGF